MYQVCCIFEHIIDTFDNTTLAQHNLLPKRHEPVLHVYPDSGNKMYAIRKKVLKEPWRDIPPVSKKSAVQFLGQYVPHFRIPVVHIGTGKAEADDLSPVIAGEVQFESVAPSHRSFPVGSYPLENFVGIAPEIVTDRNHRTVHETDARTTSESIELQEEYQFEEYPAFKFDKPIIGHCIWKFPVQVHSDIMQIIMLEISERSEMEDNQNGHNLTIGK